MVKLNLNSFNFEKPQRQIFYFPEAVQKYEYIQFFRSELDSVENQQFLQGLY